METENKSKKMSNEGHETPVRHGSKIGLVFIIGLVAGGAVTFLAVAGRTETVIQQRRELLLSKKAQERTPAAPVDPSRSSGADGSSGPVEANATPSAPGDATR